MTQQRKAKRRLSDFDFSKEGSHIALVHKDQGGAANGYETLIMKSTANLSQEFIQKVQRVKVEMELPEFLSRFYGMWYHEEAKELAKLFGWVDYSEVADKVEDAIEGERSVEFVDVSPTDYIRTKLQDVDNLANIAKSSTQDGKTDTAMLSKELASLTEEQYLMLLEDQVTIEKALKSGGKKPNKKVVSKQPIVKEADKAVHNEEKQMTEKVLEQEVEVIAKAQYDEIQKAFKEQEEQLQKATAMLAEFKQKEKEQIQKAREATLLAAVEAKDTAEKLFKAVGELEQEHFDAVVEVVKALTAKATDTDMFKEVGSQQEGEQVHKSTVQKILAQKYAN